MDKADYFVRRGDTERGPTTAARIRELAAQGKLSKDDVIRRGENGDWFRAGDLAGLFDNPGEPDGELLKDPFANLAGQAAGTLVKAAGVVGRAAGQIGGAVKGAMARRAEERSRVAVEQPPAIQRAQTVRIPAAEAELLTRKVPVEETAVCPFCGEAIKKAAKKCKHCGEILDVVLREVRQSSASHASAPAAAPAHIHITNVNTATVGGGRLVKAWSPFVAALLSFLIPGLGQLYKGQVLNGIVWFFVVAVGYALLIVPGIVLHFCCVLGAAMGDPYR